MSTRQNRNQKELSWLSAHKKEAESFSGKWIPVLDGTILASGDSVTNVMKQVRQKNMKRLPLVTKVPRKDEGIYILVVLLFLMS